MPWTAPGMASAAQNWNEMKALLPKGAGIPSTTPPHLLPVTSQKLELDHNLQGVTLSEGDDISEMN